MAQILYQDKAGNANGQIPVNQQFTADDANEIKAKFNALDTLVLAIASGNTIMSSGVPASATGADGQYYIDTASWLVYGPKASGAWPTAFGISKISNSGASVDLSSNTLTAAASSLLLNLPDGGYLAMLGSQNRVSIGNYGTSSCITFDLPATGDPQVNLFVPAHNAGDANFTATNVVGRTAAGRLVLYPLPSSAGGSLLSGTSDPVAGAGQDGDSYINTTTFTIFGPKASGAWPAGVKMIGDDGEDGDDGLSVLILNGPPVPASGEDGQAAIDTTNWVGYGPKANGAWPTGVPFIPETVQSWLDPVDDAAIITALGTLAEGDWTNSTATVTGFGELRIHKDNSWLYLGYTDNMVVRVPLVVSQSSGGSAFSPNDVCTRRILASSPSVTTTAGLNGDEYVTGSVDEIAGITVEVSNSDPATGVGYRRPTGAKYWELMSGGGSVEIKHTLHSSNATTDKLASPFTGPWFIGVVFEYAGQIGEQFAKISAGGNKGGKFETNSSKATIRLDSTFRDLDGVAADEGGLQCVFKENWIVGQKYMVGIARTHDGRNFACLGKVDTTTKPGELEVRTPADQAAPTVYYIDKMENLDGNSLVFEFQNGTKFYESFYRAGAVDPSMASDLFSYSLTEYGA